MKNKTILKVIDLSSYLLLIVGAIFIVAFEFSGKMVFLKVSTLLYILGLLIFIGFEIYRIYLKKKSGDENVKFTKKQIIFTIFKLVLVVIALVWMTYIFVRIV